MSNNSSPAEWAEVARLPSEMKPPDRNQPSGQRVKNFSRIVSANPSNSNRSNIFGKTNAGLFKLKKRPLRYLRRVGVADSMVDSAEPSTINQSSRPSTIKTHRSKYLRSASAKRKRFQRPKRMDSIQLILNENEEPTESVEIEIEEPSTSSQSLNKGPQESQPIETTDSIDASEFFALNDISTLEEPSTSSAHQTETLQEEQVNQTNKSTPAAETSKADTFFANETFSDHPSAADVASMLQIDTATASQLSKSGDILSPSIQSEGKQEHKPEEMLLTPISMELPAITLTEIQDDEPQQSRQRRNKPKHLTLNLSVVNEITDTEYPSSAMDIDTTNSRGFAAADELEEDTARRQSNGNLMRRLSMRTPRTPEVAGQTPSPTTAMPKSNKVGDANGGATFTPTIRLPDPILEEKKKTWVQNLGFSAILPNAEEKDEFKRNPLKYMHKKLVFDSNEAYFYYWSAVVSAVYVYNLIIVIARSVFVDLDGQNLWILWLILDIASDSIYLMDMFIRSHTGFLEQGLLVRDVKRIKELYYKSRQFKLDLLSILPLDYVAFVVLRKPALFRFNRLLKRERLIRFMEHTETRSSFPNAFRVGSVVWYIAVIIHWNACFYFLISETIGLGSDTWVYGVKNTQSLPEGVRDTLARRYIYSFYWSTLILTTIGEVPGPQENVEFAFVTMDLMCGVLIFATIVGNVGSMISNSNQSRTEFQNRIDSIKQYMELRKVGKQLEMRVIKWFDYLWANKQSLSDQQVLQILPNKLRAEIAMHVHFETLRKVRIFQDCEAGLLAELVLKLQLQVFSPMDYVCRKGDIGREMYIVKRGMLQVVADDGSKIHATLSEGAVFGELSILNIQGSKNGNRRTANVRSVGYTDLFVLNKTDLWNALREYPEARKILIEKGRELLRKDNLLDEEAPQESKTAEEIADELQSSVRILQTRLARLMAEHMSSETKLRDRIDYLESKLSKYNVAGDIINDETGDGWKDAHDDANDAVDEKQVDAERQKLLAEDSDTDVD